MTVQTHKFEADTGKILNIVINSLYSDRDIFLRELLSNASDAIHKRKFIGQTDQSVLNSNADEIIVTIDEKKRTVEIKDTGIGLDAADLTETLGTIARSGTSSFLDSIDADGDTKDAAKTLIGKFGVGFYSAFMVAEKVVVTTRKAGEDTLNIWESDGQTGYTISSSEADHDVGTSIKLFLRKDAKEYADKSKIRSLIKKYSDHIAIPVEMLKVDKAEAEEKSAPEWQAVNDAKALWTRSRQDISDEEYKEFYRLVSHDFAEPLTWSHNRVEGKQEYTSLLYIPGMAPFDLYQRDASRGIKLYIKRTFIMDDAEQLMPNYLRFVRGVIDSNNLLIASSYAYSIGSSAKPI